MPKFIIDTLGSDNGFEEIVKGAIEASFNNTSLELILVGPMEQINQILDNKYPNITVVDATEAITAFESPLVALRNKPNASLTVSLNLLKDDPSIDGLISAGSTGAVICGAILKLKRLEKAMPCLAAILPNNHQSNFCLVDCGANIDSPSEYLLSFAIQGASYMSAYYGIENPKVALLSNGSEDGKGDERTKKAFSLLKESSLNFVGNVEGTSVLDKDFDVLVADGFSGNIVLKTIEGTAKTIIKDIYKLSAKETNEEAKKQYQMLIQKLMSQYDFNGLGGAVLLGFDKIIIKGHGSSDYYSIMNIINQANKLVCGNILDKLKSNLK